LSAIHYSSERVSLVAILLTLGTSQEQGVQKETKNSGGFETEHQGRSGSNFSQHAATSDACGRSPAEVVGLNPTGGMDICLL